MGYKLTTVLLIYRLVSVLSSRTASPGTQDWPQRAYPTTTYICKPVLAQGLNSGVRANQAGFVHPGKARTRPEHNPKATPTSSAPPGFLHSPGRRYPSRPRQGHDHGSITEAARSECHSSSLEKRPREAAPFGLGVQSLTGPLAPLGPLGPLASD